jgi:hypothetical protein
MASTKGERAPPNTAISELDINEFAHRSYFGAGRGNRPAI